MHSTICFGTTQRQVYLQAYLDTSGSTDESYIYGVLNFNGVIFDEMMNIDFDFGIPGFNLDVEKGSKIRMALDYAINLGFGYDRNGFFLSERHQRSPRRRSSSPWTRARSKAR